MSLRYAATFRGQCCDHYFLRFLPIFGGNRCFSLFLIKNNVNIKFFGLHKKQ
jgi:hypothetical protein